MEEVKENSIDLGICDPPFGINETKFDALYKRDDTKILNGYVEAPEDYYQFSLDWIFQFKRILKPNGTLYIISGWTNLKDILVASDNLNLHLLNHCIWKFNFGVNTTKKFVSSHYHILRYCKENQQKNVKFNTFCRFGPQEKNELGKSLLFQDLEDVFTINKDFNQSEIKNSNKLPEELIKKLVLYSSDQNDVVCDFFMGNFTTAKVSNCLGRHVVGFELNKISYDFWMPKLSNDKFGEWLTNLKKVDVVIPENYGKSFSDEEKINIINDVRKFSGTKKELINRLMNKYKRGKFSIINILEKLKNEIDSPVENEFF